jgi:hypothetical protein
MKRLDRDTAVRGAASPTQFERRQKAALLLNGERLHRTLRPARRTHFWAVFRAAVTERKLLLQFLAGCHPNICRM